MLKLIGADFVEPSKYYFTELIIFFAQFWGKHCVKQAEGPGGSAFKTQRGRSGPAQDDDMGSL